MIDKRVVSVEAALEGLSDGASIMISGFGGAGAPVALIHALEQTSIRDITLIMNGIRYMDTHAPKLFGDRRVRKAICSSARGRGREPTAFERQWQAGVLEIEINPQGTFTERMRAGGAGIPAFFTPTGAGTQLAEGKETRDFDGRSCILETALTADFALLRGHLADRWGNIGFRGTQANFGPSMAAAARITVVEVEAISPDPLPPSDIGISGIYVQRIIALPDAR